jgi:hypothetical protein
LLEWCQSLRHLFGALTGNASTATALAAGRTILEQVATFTTGALMEQETFQAL